MKRPNRKLPTTIRVAAVIILLALTAAQVRAQVLLEEHEFDNTVAGWSAAGQAGGQVSWDAIQGSPTPGSLRLDAPASSTSPESFKAVSQCRSVEPGQPYTVVAGIRPSLGPRSGRCFAVPVFFDNPDCQGEGSIGGTGDAGADGVWEIEAREQTAFTSSQGLRIELVMSLQPGSGEAYCHFDSVALYRGRVSERVPGPGWPGLLLVGAGILLLARRRLGRG